MSDDLVKRAAALVEKEKAWDEWEYPSQPAPPAMVQGEVATLVSDMAAEITRLRAELATARREGMEEAAKAVINLSISTPSVIAATIRAAAGEGKPGEYLTEAEQERDEFFNRLGRITEYLDLPVDATAQRIIETLRERVKNEREACASVEVRVIVPDGAETWTPLEAWEEAIIAFDEAFRDAIRAAAKEVK